MTLTLPRKGAPGRAIGWLHAIRADPTPEFAEVIEPRESNHGDHRRIGLCAGEVSVRALAPRISTPGEKQETLTRQQGGIAWAVVGVAGEPVEQLDGKESLVEVGEQRGTGVELGKDRADISGCGGKVRRIGKVLVGLIDRRNGSQHREQPEQLKLCEVGPESGSRRDVAVWLWGKDDRGQVDYGMLNTAFLSLLQCGDAVPTAEPYDIDMIRCAGLLVAVNPEVPEQQISAWRVCWCGYRLSCDPASCIARSTAA